MAPAVARSTRDAERIAARYDKLGDVLYVAKGPAVPGFVESGPRGILLRFSEIDETPCGVTVIGFKETGWDHELERLASLIARHIGSDAIEVTAALRTAS